MGYRQTTDDNIIGRVRFECRIIKATDTHSECVTHKPFHLNSDCTNAPQLYVIRSLPVLFYQVQTHDRT